MIVLICPDKFKASISATELCNVISSELTQINPNIQCINMPMADGGDGSLDVLNENIGLNSIIIKSTDPKGRIIYPRYLSDGYTAYIELAEASGIQHLQPDELDVLNYNTVGTGKLLQHALKLNHSEIVLCLGGSCTNDMGLGIAQALGFSFHDKNGNTLNPSGGNLHLIQVIKKPENQINCQFKILADVQNPLYGPTGAAYTFAKQKGASPEDITLLDVGMQNVANLIQKQFDKDISSIPGGGAAGGIAGGLLGLLNNIQLESGVSFMANTVGLESAIQKANLVITGEGKLDATSLNGKVVGYVAVMCKKYQVDLKTIVGNTTLTLEEIQANNIGEVFTVISKASSLQDAMNNPQIYIQQIVSNEMDLHTIVEAS